MLDINWTLFVLWMVCGLLISIFLAPYVLSFAAKRKMTVESKVYAGLFTAFISFFLAKFFGMYYLWIVLANASLWFLLPMWWKIDSENKTKILLFYVGTNLIAQLIVYFIFSAIQLGA